MGEAIINNLSSILFGLAALVTAIAALISIIINRGKLREIDKKVDGGMTKLQEALAEIAKTASAATVNRSVRATDLKDNG